LRFSNWPVIYYIFPHQLGTEFLAPLPCIKEEAFTPSSPCHQAAIKSLELVEDKLKQHSSKKKSTYYEDKGKKSRKYQSSQSQKSDSTGDKDHKA
jgi:hypothetical protein